MAQPATLNKAHIILSTRPVSNVLYSVDISQKVNGDKLALKETNEKSGLLNVVPEGFNLELWNALDTECTGKTFKGVHNMKLIYAALKKIYKKHDSICRVKSVVVFNGDCPVFEVKHCNDPNMRSLIVMFTDTGKSIY